MFAFASQTGGQKILHAETPRAYNQLILMRRLHLDAIHSGLPAAMRWAVMIGVLITLASSFSFDVGSVWRHQVTVGLLASLTGLLSFVIVIYDSPLRGQHGVSTDAYELVFNQLMR